MVGIADAGFVCIKSNMRGLGGAHRHRPYRFNTQPPEGGCFGLSCPSSCTICFNTQPPEGGCVGAQTATHAGRSFNTQPLKGSWDAGIGKVFQSLVSTQSHPKVAALLGADWQQPGLFQHTATRRWLVGRKNRQNRSGGFNTQPSEGGWETSESKTKIGDVSTHNHPEVGGYLKISHRFSGSLLLILIQAYKCGLSRFCGDRMRSSSASLKSWRSSTTSRTVLPVWAQILPTRSPFSWPI